MVFETVSFYPEKWWAEHGEKKKEMARFVNEASSIGWTFSLPRPPARGRDKGRSLEPSAFYLPDVDLASGELKTANFITNLSGDDQYTPYVTLPKRGKDDSPEESVFPSLSLDNNERRGPNSAETSLATNLSTGRLQVPYKETSQIKSKDKSKDVNRQRGEKMVKTNQSFLGDPSRLRIRDSNGSKDEEEEVNIILTKQAIVGKVINGETLLQTIVLIGLTVGRKGRKEGSLDYNRGREREISLGGEGRVQC